MTTDRKAQSGPMYKEIDGRLMSHYFSSSLYRSALNYRARPDDMFLVTFPKCGTTWTDHIVHLIFNRGFPPTSTQDIFSARFLEMVGAEGIEAMKRPGLIVTHLPYDKVPNHPQAKYLYVCRNPKDTCVSFFHHTRALGGYEFTDGKFEEYFEIFLQGNNDYGDYFDHVLSWYSHKDDANVLFIHYEDMKSDTRGSVLKIAEFLSEEHHQLLLDNENVLSNVMKYSHINAMKQYAIDNFRNFFANPLENKDASLGLKRFHGLAQRHGGSGSFIRKGIIGDWKEHMDPNMNARMEQKILEKLSRTELVDTWRKHGVVPNAASGGENKT